MTTPWKSKKRFANCITTVGLSVIVSVASLLPLQAAPDEDSPKSGPGIKTKTNPTSHSYFDTLRTTRQAYTRALSLARGKTVSDLVEIPGMPNDYVEAILAQVRLHAFPNKSLNYAAYDKGITVREHMPPATSNMFVPGTVSPTGARGTASFNGAITNATQIQVRGAVRWEPVGPVNWQVLERGGNGYGMGPSQEYVSGRINAIAYDPKNPNTLYAASAGGGLWKTINGGTQWYAVGDSFPFLQTSAVAVSPKNSQIVLAGLGDFDGSIPLAFAYYSFGYGRGIMRSTDGGRSWTNVGGTAMSGLAISNIVFDPDNPDVVLATAGRGSKAGQIFRSINGGASWSTVTIRPATANISWCDVRIGTRSTTTGSRLFYAVAEQGSGSDLGGVYVSSDGGLSWDKITSYPRTFSSQLGGGLTSHGRVATSAMDANTIYVASGFAGKVDKGVRDATGNYTWTDLTPTTATNDFSLGQAFYDLHLTAVPQVAAGKVQDFLYCGLLGVSVSPGGTQTGWKSVTNVYGADRNSHTDQHCLAVNPLNANEMMIGNDGGITKVTYDSTKNKYTFKSVNAGLSITEFYCADFNPFRKDFAVGGAQDNSTGAVLGNASRWYNTGAGDGQGVGINPTNPDILYFSSQYNGLFRTTTGLRNDPGLYFAPDETGTADQKTLWNNEFQPFNGRIAVDQTYPHPLYVGTDYLWRWNENTRTWDAHLGGVQLSPLGYVYAIAVAPSDPNRIYIGTDQGELWVSTDKGANWRKLSAGKTGDPLPLRGIVGISVHPKRPNDIVVTVTGTGSAHVFRSTNVDVTKPTFTALPGTGNGILPDVPFECVERDPNRPDTTFFVGTHIGVFMTTDGGTTWTDANTPMGLPNGRVTSIKAAPRAGYLYLSTYGRGMWRIPLSGLATLN